VYGKDRSTFIDKANELLEAIRTERDDVVPYLLAFPPSLLRFLPPLLSFPPSLLAFPPSLLTFPLLLSSLYLPRSLTLKICLLSTKMAKREGEELQLETQQRTINDSLRITKKRLKAHGSFNSQF
jgi:hypothetical protein